VVQMWSYGKRQTELDSCQTTTERLQLSCNNATAAVSNQNS
jgi:hypothetical protein